MAHGCPVGKWLVVFENVNTWYNLDINSTLDCSHVSKQIGCNVLVKYFMAVQSARGLWYSTISVQCTVYSCCSFHSPHGPVSKRILVKYFTAVQSARGLSCSMVTERPRSLYATRTGHARSGSTHPKGRSYDCLYRPSSMLILPVSTQNLTIDSSFSRSRDISGGVKF